MTAPDPPNKFQEGVRESIRKDATFDRAHLLMNILAATIASYGLFANSPAVVIGAMIVAMLLGPIAGIALALVDSDLKLLVKSLSTLLAGTLGVMFTALIIGTIHKDIPITNEIVARTAPNLLDLMIALAGGAAGAYANVSPRLSIAFVGVAIATALVPPLAAASILFARAEIGLSLGALLLAFTNMISIQFAFSVVLWANGYRQVTSKAGISILVFIKRNIISMAILLLLATVLSRSLHQVVFRELYETKTRFTLQQQLNAAVGNYVQEVRFETTPGKTIVRALVRGPKAPSATQVAAMENQLPAPPERTKVELRVRFVQTTIVNRDGQLYQDGAFGSSQ